MSDQSPDATWPKYPFDTDCAERVPADQAVIEAVRKVLDEWDGENWAAVREVLEPLGKTPDQLLAMTLADVRACLAVRQRPILKLLEGRPHTTDATIIDVDPPAPKKRIPPERWLAEAMIVVEKYPEWSDRSVAKKVGINHSQLSRSPGYQKAAGIARDQGRKPAKGHTNIRTSQREAVDDRTPLDELIDREESGGTS